MIEERHDDISWWSASQTAAAIADREVSSREVLDHLVERIERLDGPINSVVQWDLDRARAAAAAADRAVAAGDDLGPLHGVPMTIKDSFQTVGCITTSGAPELADHVPNEDAAPIARLREAGAIPFAKTNLPLYAGDIQSYNDVYGTTNNPHHLERTAGGSSGGSAAALSMGFTSLELGSDIGGSIRTPAHFCGVMSHKPSFGIVPAHGQIPGPPGTLSQADLAVAGPMARSADDLALALDVLAGPDRWDAPAWRLELPGPGVERLAGLRVATWLDDESCPVDASTAAAMSALAASLHGAGAHVDTEARPGFTLDRVWQVFSSLLFAALSGGHPREKIEHLAADTSDSALGRVKRATAARHRDWLTEHERRLQMRAGWER
ncbi:MAG: amidase family protein, partial [Actinomycetota bacterium]